MKLCDKQLKKFFRYGTSFNISKQLLNNHKKYHFSQLLGQHIVFKSSDLKFIIQEMKSSKKQPSVIHLIMETEEKIESEINFFEGMPKTLKSIPQVITNQNSMNSQNELQENSLKNLALNHEFLPPAKSQNTSNSNNSDSLQGNSLMQLSKTANMLNKKKKQLKNRKIRHCTQQQQRNEGKNVIINQRISKICENFINKIRRNNIFSFAAVNEDDLQRYFYHTEVEGFQMSTQFFLFYHVFTAISIISLILSQTFVFAFPELAYNSLVLVVLVMSALSFSFMIIVNLIAIRRIDGRKMCKLRQIAVFYIKKGDFIVDIITLILIFIQCRIYQSYWKDVLLVTLFFKINNLMQKLSIIEQMMVKSYYYQRYWSLLKLILFNFAFAHFIAILLNLMANQYPDKNWQTVKGISNDPWIQRYVWAYYWATTTMLTVGFGDIVPAVYQQALWVIFIEIVSCMAFSYNISCLGNLIGNIRAQSEQIEKNRKIFEAMNKKIGFSDELTDKMQHYISESVNIKSKFNIEQEKQFIQNLPESYKKLVKCETNKNLLKSLPFFSCLLNKTIYKLAACMERHIYYPEEIVKPKQSQFTIYILESGKIGCTCKKFDSSYNGIVANVIKLKEKDHPFLISQEFITLQPLNYQIKSMGYSVVHKLKYLPFLENLRSMYKDYEFFAFLRDKSKNIVDEYETIKCNLCPTNHSYFDCPKYHYIPIKQNIIRKQIKKYQSARNGRISFIRSEEKSQNTLAKLAEYQKNIRLLNHTQIVNNFNKKLTGGQIQMRRFLLNIYNFQQKTHHYSKMHDSSSITKNNIEQQEWLDMEDVNEGEFQWIWGLQFDKTHDYNIYFPEDNSNRLHQRYGGQKAKRIKDPFVASRRRYQNDESIK